jgi:hypothetical protein
LQLAVEHDAIGDDDRRIEDRLIRPVVQVDRLVGRPANRVRFPGSGGMLDQVVVSGSMSTGMGRHPPHRVQLLEAWKDHSGLAVVTLLQVDELADHIEPDLTGKDRLSLRLVGVEISNTEISRDVRISGPTVSSTVERQKPRLAIHQPSGHRNVVFVQGKVNERPTLERQ